MTTECKPTLMTPVLARALLEVNTRNRPLREAQIQYLADQIKCGQWQTTPDAIGVRSDGILLNGQHRLHAIVRADKPVVVLLATGLAPEAFLVTDRRNGRSLSDVTELRADLVADLSLLARFLDLTITSRVPEYVVRDTAAWWKPVFYALEDYADGRHAKGVFNAVVRVGFGVRWAISQTAPQRDYVLTQYRALMQNDTHTMSTAGATVWRRMLRDRAGSGTYASKMKNAAMVFYCMDRARAEAAPIVRSPEDAIRELTQWVGLMGHAFLRAAPEASHPYYFVSRPTLAAPARRAPTKKFDADTGRSEGFSAP